MNSSALSRLLLKAKNTRVPASRYSWIPAASPCRAVSWTFAAAAAPFSTSHIAKPSRSASVSESSAFDKTPEEMRKWNRTGEDPKYKLGKHRSNALELVSQVPVVEVDGYMAVCDGGGGALGHPLEYISLERPGAVESCKYCSLRFTKKKKH